LSYSLPAGRITRNVPKRSRPRSVSAQTTPPSTHAQAAGSDGDLRHDRASEPSTAGIESNSSPQPTVEDEGSWPFAKDPDYEDDYGDYYEKLLRVIEQARAVSFAHHALEYYWTEAMGMTGENPYSESLADLGVRTCDEALRLTEGLRNAAACWKTRALALVIPDQDQLTPAQACTARMKAEAAFREQKRGSK